MSNCPEATISREVVRESKWRLARITNRRLMVRLVKGAYWDSEIKHAQEQGLPDYPVFTRKHHTDLCYENCAARLLAADPHAVFPQFATHNAHTACSVLALTEKTQRDEPGSTPPAGAQDVDRVGFPGQRPPASHGPQSPSCRFEFQRLHGMGHALYSQLLSEAPFPLRIYAPVGSHRDLLPYLVRRLLENGANSSFVNRFMDTGTPVELLVKDCLKTVLEQDQYRHPSIPVPPEIFRRAGEDRANSAGIDLHSPFDIDTLLTALRKPATRAWRAGPIIGGTRHYGRTVRVFSPSDRRRTVGLVSGAGPNDVDAALELADAAQHQWNALGADARAATLETAADLLEVRRADFVALIAVEAGRTLADALAEVREAVDFCRYYALQARQKFSAPIRLPGPTGEVNELSLHGRGVFACISPWNFPLAIFLGQVSAALAAGNTVVAKPAEQTPLVAAQAALLLHEAGVPGDALHLLPGDGPRVGGRIVADGRVAGVAFTGSFGTARLIEQELARRPGPITPLIAETGGQNVMLVDSTALPEQVVDDVIASVFQSAGQRCSALRVLYLQEEIADRVLTMLAGAMRTLVMGDPLDPMTDIGPVIDEPARERLERHVTSIRRTGRLVVRCDLPRGCDHGSFFAPCLFEIDSIRQLDHEVFGPVLHVVRFSAHDLDRVLDEIQATGYGLTLGIQSRIGGFAREVSDKIRVGNVYVNRNMIGAVVGVHPFGGRGLSGTGPKAGGPHYLLRFVTERSYSDNVAAQGGNVELFDLQEP